MPEDVKERLAIYAFLDGLWDHEIRQAVILARPDKLVNALATALEFEAAKEISRGSAQVKRTEDSSKKGVTINEAAVRKIAREMMYEKEPIHTGTTRKDADALPRKPCTKTRTSPRAQRKKAVISRPKVVNNDRQSEEWGRDQKINGAASKGLQKHPRGPMGRDSVGSSSKPIAVGTAGLSSKSNREVTFETFMAMYSNGQRSQHGVTREEQRDLFATPTDYSLAHCVSEDLEMSNGIAVTFREKYGQMENLRSQGPELGKVLQIVSEGRPLFYLVTKKSFDHKTTYQDLWNSLIQLRDQMLTQDLRNSAIPKIACGLDKLSWQVVRSMLEEIFRSSGIDILVCCHNPQKAQKKTVDCYFHKMSR
jgi:hypothetical protein